MFLFGVEHIPTYVQVSLHSRAVREWNYDKELWEQNAAWKYQSELETYLGVNFVMCSFTVLEFFSLMMVVLNHLSNQKRLHLDEMPLVWAQVHTE